MIRLDVSALIKARLGASLNLNVDLGPQNLLDLDIGFLRGTFQATRIQGGLLVEGNAESQLELDCVRCLTSFVLPVSLELEEIFRLPEASPKPEISYAVSDDGWIDLAPIIRELAWVVIPLRPLCHLDCVGLCPHCGANLNSKSCACRSLNIDPRWASLKELL